MIACLNATFSLDRLVNFLSVNWNLGWSLNSEANFIPTDINDGDHNVIANHDTFVAVA